jgi:hypothetical protein
MAEFFIAWREGAPIGTICTADDKFTNARRGRQDCLIGFFECVDDYTVAEALFQYAACWARTHDLNCLYGPFNLDYEDSYGVLLEGRDRPPVLLCGHTPPYYQVFFERFGFNPARGDNLAYEINYDMAKPVVKRLVRLAERLWKQGNIHIREADLPHWEEEVERVLFLLNTALVHLPDFIPWERDVLRATLDPLLQIVDPERIRVAEVDGKTVGWFPGIPNINEALIHANGLRHP